MVQKRAAVGHMLPQSASALRMCRSKVRGTCVGPRLTLPTANSQSCRLVRVLSSVCLCLNAASSRVSLHVPMVGALGRWGWSAMGRFAAPSYAPLLAEKPSSRPAHGPVALLRSIPAGQHMGQLHLPACPVGAPVWFEVDGALSSHLH